MVLSAEPCASITHHLSIILASTCFIPNPVPGALQAGLSPTGNLCNASTKLGPALFPGFGDGHSLGHTGRGGGKVVSPRERGSHKHSTCPLLSYHGRTGWSPVSDTPRSSD